ncbi:MBOAT, membrane-bound O-acyltransferase family-domain-containing protein [Lanmaoa asiatica]|nr:MBOAT, membrane-bound O-acyltransferase family-domain-containing protein [Lanmaoa asiatica]
MPESGPSGVGSSTSLSAVYSETLVSVSGSSNGPAPPSSTLFLSPSLSPSTSNFTTTPDGLLASDGSSPVVYAEAILCTIPPTTTTTSSSMPPAAYGHPTSFGRTGAILATQSGYIDLVFSASSSTYSPAPSPAPIPASSDTSATWATSFANSGDYAMAASTSGSAPESTSTRVPTSTSTSVYSTVGKATTGTESACTSAHAFGRPPKAPQQIVSPLFTVITQITQSGSTLLTTITSGGLVPVPTTSNNVPNSSSTSNSLLPLILGPVLGMLVIVPLGVTFFRCCTRRPSKNMSNALSSDSESLRERKDWAMVEETPRVDAVILDRAITSHRGSPTRTPEHMTTCISYAGESSQNSNGQYSNPFAGSSDIVSSRTSMHPASIHSVDSVSTDMAFTVSMNADTRDIGDIGSSIDASTSSLELHFVAPLVATDDTSTQSPYLSPSWHYDSQSPTSSPREGEYWDEEQRGEISPISLRASPPAPPKPFPFGTESARLHLHALFARAMDALFSPLANALGASIDQIKLIWCLLIAYPLGSLFIRIPSSQPSLKHLFNVFISVFFFIPVLDLQWGFLQLLGSVLGTYFIAANFRGSNMPWIVFMQVKLLPFHFHVIRAVFGLSYETVEITGPQMVLTMKLTTFAWNIYDGRRPQEDLDKWQLQKRITKYPTLLEFLGFSFYFPGVLVGPYLDYASYTSLIDESLFKSVESTKPMRRAIPDGRKRVAYRKMLMGLVFLGLFVVLNPSYNFAIALTPWFAEQSLLYRITVFQFYGLIERCKYYAVWTLTEGASILTGLGFTGFGPSGESLWEGAANVKILDIELPSNFKVLLDSWNINTNIWLRECVYKRVTPKGKKPGFSSTLITFATSAFWHGIAVGYYITFILGGFITYVGRKCRAGFRPLVMPLPGAQFTWTKGSYDFLGTLISIFLLNFVAAPFMVLTYADSMKVWSRLGWYGCWIVGSGVVFFNAGGSKYLQSLQKKRARIVDVNKPQSPSPHIVDPLKPAAEKPKMRMN